MNRRKFLETSTALLSAGALSSAAAVGSEPSRKYRLIATEEALHTLPPYRASFRGALLVRR